MFHLDLSLSVLLKNLILYVSCHNFVAVTVCFGANLKDELEIKSKD